MMDEALRKRLTITESEQLEIAIGVIVCRANAKFDALIAWYSPPQTLFEEIMEDLEPRTFRRPNLVHNDQFTVNQRAYSPLKMGYGRVWEIPKHQSWCCYDSGRDVHCCCGADR